LEFISDPWFYALAVPAVLIVGFSKAGVGGGLGIMAVPLMALIVPPVQAAAVLMPLLLFMDVFSLRAYWGIFHRRNLMILLPGSLIGVAVGGLTFGYMNDDMIRILIGAIAILFTLYRWVGLRLLKRAADHRAPPNRATGTFWAGVGGFTSVVAHGGSPPVHIYLLPQRLDKRVFIGTTVILFALVDVMKLVPYGQDQPDHRADPGPVGARGHLARRDLPAAPARGSVLPGLLHADLPDRLPPRLAGGGGVARRVAARAVINSRLFP
jgi:uncharacterized membrane protein YfcA